MLSFFPRDVLDEILNLFESVSEGFPTFSAVNSLNYVIILHIAGWVIILHGALNYKDFSMYFILFYLFIYLFIYLFVFEDSSSSSGASGKLKFGQVTLIFIIFFPENLVS